MNKVILMGRLTRDPDIRYSAGENSMAVARYTLAVDRRFKRDGEQTADFISCVAFGRSAEFAEKIFPSGDPHCCQRQDPDGKLHQPGRSQGLHYGCSGRGSGVRGEQERPALKTARIQRFLPPAGFFRSGRSGRRTSVRGWIYEYSGWDR